MRRAGCLSPKHRSGGRSASKTGGLTLHTLQRRWKPSCPDLSIVFTRYFSGTPWLSSFFYPPYYPMLARSGWSLSVFVAKRCSASCKSRGSNLRPWYVCSSFRTPKEQKNLVTVGASWICIAFPSGHCAQDVSFCYVALRYGQWQLSTTIPVNVTERYPAVSGLDMAPSANSASV